VLHLISDFLQRASPAPGKIMKFSPFFIRMMIRIIKIGIANGLPIAEGKSEFRIHPLITVD
jgi:hypothetical protein